MLGKWTRDWPSLEVFDEVMVGSGVRIGRWMGEPREFLKRNREEPEGKKQALFISCFSAVSAPNCIREELLERVMEETGVRVDLYEAFGPLVDFGKGSRMGFLDRKIAQMVMGRTSGETGVELDMNGGNDLRDWEKVIGFAQRFAEMLKAPRADSYF